MFFAFDSALNSLLTVIAILFVVALIAPFFSSRQQALIYLFFTAVSGACIIALIAGASALAGPVETMVLPIGLPDLPFYLRLDGLSGFFIFTISLLGLFVSIYSIGYMKTYLGKRSVTRFVVFYALFMAGMLLVPLADDAFFFLVSWELMAISSYFLVLFKDEDPKSRKGAFIYILVAHIGAILILLSFGVTAGFTLGFDTFEGYTFSAMRGSALPPFWASAAFLLAFTGFAAKAGVIPLHIWLPEAHPAAPSNVSALMSGVMLKTAIYGMVRVSFDIIHIGQWWWGGLVLALGLVSAVMGVLYALMEHDLKRLLAYHSVENIGIILIGLGLSMMFVSFDKPYMAALAMIAAFYHTLNHAMFKGLLFMGAGAVVQATRQRNMDEMGGLIHKMPWTAVLFLIGCISISALPPLNGFVSEWLTFQAFLLSPSMPHPILNLLIPLGASLLALAGALAAACFVKVFGVVFLGRPRAHHTHDIREAGWSMKAGMTLAAVTCLLLGLIPPLVIKGLNAITVKLVGAGLTSGEGAYEWLWLAPVAPERASYSAPIVFTGIVATVAVVYLLLHIRKREIRKAPIWDCGFPKQTSRMQYNASAFSMPIRRVLGFLFDVRESVRKYDDGTAPAFSKRYLYRLRIKDRFWGILYRPVTDTVFWMAQKTGKLQHGKIQIYILYSFITIIVLLLFN